MPDHRVLIRLLHEIDGQLGLAVYRGETGAEWKRESEQLIVRIRNAIADLHAADDDA